VATGYLEIGDNNDGLIETLSDGTWTPIEAPLPADAASGQQTSIDGVACPAVGTCVAVGGYLGHNGTPALIETLSNGTWTPTAAPLPANAAATPAAGLNGIACPAVGTCVAVGVYTDKNNVYQGLVETLSNGAWAATELPRPSGAAGSKNVGLGSVSCPTADNCVATGWYNYTSALHAYPSLIATLSARRWATVGAPAPAGTSANRVFLGEVACSAPGSCLTAGSYNYTNPNNEGDGLAETLSRGKWTPVRIGAPASGATSNYFFGVACPAVGICMAAGAYYTASDDSIQGLIETTSRQS